MNDAQLKELGVEIVDDGVLQERYRYYKFGSMKLRVDSGSLVTPTHMRKAKLRRVADWIFSAGQRHRAQCISILIEVPRL